MDGRKRGQKPPGSKSKERRLGPIEKDKPPDFLTGPGALHAAGSGTNRHGSLIR
jgi:hypothetical protein